MMKLAIGREKQPEPQINFWLEERAGSIHLVAKHSEGDYDQRIVVIDFKDGKACISIKTLHNTKLCTALGVELKSAPDVTIENYE